jgi:hypothetical protein
MQGNRHAFWAVRGLGMWLLELVVVVVLILVTYPLSR